MHPDQMDDLSRLWESRGNPRRENLSRRLNKSQVTPSNPADPQSTPVSALAATVSGLARKTFASLWPMRPGKLRLVVLMQLIGVFSRPKVSLGPPRQAAHDGSPIFAPARRKISSQRLAVDLLGLQAGGDLARRRHHEGVDLARVLPLRIRAAARKSVILPPVHEPM